MGAFLKSLIMIAIFNTTITGAVEIDRNTKFEERLFGFQVIINLKKQTEKNLGDMCILEFVSVQGNQFAFEISPGALSPRSLRGSPRNFKFNKINNNRLEAKGCEQYWLEGGGKYSTVKCYDEAVIYLNTAGEPETFEILSDNGIDMIRCESLKNVGI